MAWSREQQEEYWMKFNEGQGSVIHRAPTKSGRLYLTFITPSGEKFSSWNKAQEYVRMHGQVLKGEADSNHDAKLAKPPLSNKPSSSRLSLRERREFRDWFWRKNGGQVTRKEYVDHKNFPFGRWEAKYITSDGAKSFRSWKECVKFLGTDPDPSTTSWNKYDQPEDGLTPIEVIRRIDVNKVKRIGETGRQLTSTPISTAGATTSKFSTDPKVDNVASIDPVEVSMAAKLIKGNPDGHPKCLLEESENSSTEERLTLRSKEERSEAENVSRYGNLRSKLCNRKELSIEDGDLKAVAPDKREEENSGKEQNNAVSSRIRKTSHETKNGRTGRKRKRVLILNSTSEETSEHEAKDFTDADLNKDEVHSAECPQVVNGMSVKELKAVEPGGRLRMLTDAQEKSKGNGIDTSESKHLRKNVVTFYDESNCEPKDQHDEGFVSVDDETLQKSLIDLLYADHIKQPSRQTNGKVIGKLYAEFIERGFALRQESSNSRHLALALNSRKRRSQSSRDQRKPQRIKYTSEKRNSAKPARKLLGLIKSMKRSSSGKIGNHTAS